MDRSSGRDRTTNKGPNPENRVVIPKTLQGRERGPPPHRRAEGWRSALWEEGSFPWGQMVTGHSLLQNARCPLLGVDCTAHVPNCSKPSISEPRRIWLGKDNSCCELVTQTHLLSPLMVPRQSPEWERARLAAGSRASHLSEEEQRSLGNKGTLPSLGLFLKRTLPAWNWLKSGTAARTAHPRCRPVAS